MAFAKVEAFQEHQIQMAKLAKALGHPARIAILEILIKRNACVCGDLVDELPLSQATVSQHLKELKEAGLIQGTIDGPRICYCIDPEAWESTKAQFQMLFEKPAACGPTCNC